MTDRKDRPNQPGKTLGQRQGDINPEADTDVPPKGGVGQSGARNPDRPATEGVDQKRPGQQDKT